MNRFSFIFSLLFAFGITASAQVSPTCPSFEIRETEPPARGAMQTLTVVTSDKAALPAGRFEWSAENGRIIEGQGTPTVKILWGAEISWTKSSVRVIGLGKGCEPFSSLATIIEPGPSASQLLEFSAAPAEINGSALNYLINNLGLPSDNGCIIEYFAPNVPARAKAAKKRRTLAYLKARGLALDRVVYRQATAARNLTRLFLVPMGAAMPEP